MILKRLKMDNFRSYANADVSIPSGINLFEGDIGSGKSSILYAIEFALFGLGDMRGENLMSSGKDKTSVLLEFDIDGKDYAISRSLARSGKNVVQKEGFVLSGGKKFEASPTEMRTRILEILNFNESLKTRSNSVIFRYAVFTPQEEMKEILRLRAEDRLQTLRKAFGLEDYKNAKDNSKLVTDELKSRIRFMEGEISNLDVIIKQKAGNQSKVESFRIKFNNLNEKKSIIESEYMQLDEKYRQLDEIRKGYEKLAAQIPALNSELRSKNSDLKFAFSDIESSKLELDRIEKRISELSTLQVPGNRSAIEIEKEIRVLESSVLGKSEATFESKSKMRNIRELLDKKICPTCKRELEPGHYHDELSALENQHVSAEQEVKHMREQVEILRIILKKQEEFERSQSETKRLAIDIERVRIRISSSTTRINETQNRINELEIEIPKLENEAAKGKSVMEKITELEKNKSETEQKLRYVISETSSLSGQIKTLEESIETLEKQIIEKNEHRARLVNFTQHLLWMNEYFIPVIDKIEKHVLVNINAEFSQLFAKWFDMLLDDSGIAVKIDENFTPIVEQNGYEMDIESLSGGEKTSIAFAYRLALNMMVRKVCTSMKSNLLILDEPTDGFSKEQLFKVRDVLNEMKCEQVILVSHERELESFVDKIFYVEKRAGISEILER